MLLMIMGTQRDICCWWQHGQGWTAYHIHKAFPIIQHRWNLRQCVSSSIAINLAIRSFVRRVPAPKWSIGTKRGGMPHTGVQVTARGCPRGVENRYRAAGSASGCAWSPEPVIAAYEMVNGGGWTWPCKSEH